MSTNIVGIKLVDNDQFYSQALWGINKVVKISIDKGHIWASLVCPFCSSLGCGQRSDDDLQPVLAPHKRPPIFKHYDATPPQTTTTRATSLPRVTILFYVFCFCQTIFSIYLTIYLSVLTKLSWQCKHSIGPCPFHSFKTLSISHVST